MTDSALVCQPIAGPERIDMLDALRGFALFGILLMNLEAFTGPISQAITGIDARLAGADRWSDNAGAAVPEIVELVAATRAAR